MKDFSISEYYIPPAPLANFKEYIEKNLAKKGFDDLNYLFDIMKDFNYMCADYLEKHHHIVCLLESGAYVKEIYKDEEYNYKIGVLVLISEMLKYSKTSTRPVTRAQRNTAIFKMQRLQFRVQNGNPSHEVSTDYNYAPDLSAKLEKHTVNREDYLARYPEVVELIKEGVSIRKIANQTNISHATVKKVAIIWKNDPKYKKKYANVVALIEKGLPQRDIVVHTGVSLQTVNIVATLCEFDYIEQYRKTIAKKSEKNKKRKRDKIFLKGFIMKKYKIWKKTPLLEFREKFTAYIMPLRPPGYTDKQFTPLVDEFIKNRITKTLAELKRKQWEDEKKKHYEAKRRREDAKRERKRLHRLECVKLIEDYIENPTEEKLKVLKNKDIPVPETNAEKEAKQREVDARVRARNIKALDQLLAVGINPFADEWNSSPPEKYFNTFYKTISIADYWYEDQIEMNKLTEQIPDMKDYSDKNVKEINEDERDKYLGHRAILKYHNLWFSSNN